MINYSLTAKYSKSTLKLFIFVFHVHPFLLILTSLIDLFLFLGQLYFHLVDGLFYLLIDYLAVLLDLFVLFEVLLATVQIV